MIKTHRSRSISTLFHSIFLKNSSENHGQADSGALEHFRLTPGRQNSKNHQKSLFLYHSRSISTRFYSIFFKIHQKITGKSIPGRQSTLGSLRGDKTRKTIKNHCFYIVHAQFQHDFTLFFFNSSEKYGQADSGGLEHFRLTPGQQNLKNNQKYVVLAQFQHDFTPRQ